MSRISSRAWGVCGLGLLVMLIAEVLRTTGIALYLWGSIWVVGWVTITVGLGIVLKTRAAWSATAISILATLLGLYFSGTGANGSFEAMSSISVVAVATLVGMIVQMLVGLSEGFRSLPPAYSVTASLAGVGVILLAGAFALLANGMALGFLAFGFSLGLVGTAVIFGAVAVLRRPGSAAAEVAARD